MQLFQKEAVMTISYSELTYESDQFIIFLHDLDIKAARKDDSYRDYHVKIVVNNLTVILYHKPSKQTFSIGTQEIKDPQQKKYIEELWYKYQHKDVTPNKGLCAYVDGSFYQKQVGWGVVVVENDQVITTMNGKLTCPLLAESHQIAGEVEGVIQALNYAFQNNYKQITIYYDYLGLQKWACREWKANSFVAQQYIERLKEFPITIDWVKVKAHTGNQYNEIADQLAKGIYE